jgi:hypothetical protein
MRRMITPRYFIYALSFVAMSSILGCSNQYRENIQAANNGDAIAQYEVGISYLEGKGIDKNADHALNWFKKSSDLGFKKADIAYAETSFSINMGLAEKGNADGQYRVALALLQGYGVKKDDGKALDWFTKAAKQNHGNAVMALSKIIGVSNSVTNINNSADRYKNDQERFNVITVSDKPKIFELYNVNDGSTVLYAIFDEQTRQQNVSEHSSALKQLKQMIEEQHRRNVVSTIFQLFNVGQSNLTTGSKINVMGQQLSANAKQTQSIQKVFDQVLGNMSQAFS